ncbi:MAG: ferritin [Clostridiales bacterium]|uniref:ferritin n=1 Tax=Evtepia sp. TaxID=2773933 RepID=UPI002987D6EB|nr:ferritin [Evtepia sp.]MDD7288599.1 ferritin [Clostridiales bacterium]MDY3993963.1 ferritin [Evtepia sp.]MDY4429970.1 ferritin [Evtepia sp.]
MLKKEVSALLEQQINKELYSAYLYLDISNYYYAKNLNGFGNWFKIQAQEEQDHALLFLTYLQNNGEAPKLAAIAAPDKTFSNFRDPLAAALEHEEYVTSLINAIYAEAIKANDFRTLQFLDWFVKEQGEEEKNTNDLLGRFDLFGSDLKSLYALDAELASRTYSAPSLTL